MSNIVLYRDPALKEFYDALQKIRDFFNFYNVILNGYRGFKLGQRIRVEFYDSFMTANLDMYIIDILIQKEENFGLLIVPVDYDTLSGNTLNPMVKEIFDTDNLSTPRDGCFFAKHMGRDRFELEIERVGGMKTVGKFSVDVGYNRPKLFRIPSVAIERVKCLYDLLVNKNEFPFEMKRLIYGNDSTKNSNH